MRMTCSVRLSWTLLLLLPACREDDDAEPSLDPAGAPASQELSDELDDPATLSRWRQWDKVQGDSRTEHLDLAQSHPGMLTLRPKAGGWYGSYSGPLVYKMVQGDFRVETWVSAAKLGNPEASPDEQFNSAGLIARDPEHGPGHDDWVMVNVGRQLGQLVGSEGKTTVGSQSTLEMVDGAFRGRLRICRVGGVIVLARMLEGETAWRVLNRYDRSDLPEDLQVGMVATGWCSSEQAPDLSRTPDVEATFDYVRFAVPGGEADCVAE
jgi:hypothetical protein